MHPGKEAGALHPKDRDENVGDKDQEDDNGHAVVQAVKTLLIGLLGDISPSCNTHARARTHTHPHTAITTKQK